MTVPDIRALFPYLETGRIYLNHASTAPLSRYVITRMQEMMETRSRREIEYYPDTLRLVNETRELAAAMLHCSPTRLAFVQNTSDGLNILAGGIDWKSGDRILLNDHEFPSNVYPFLNQRRHGVEIDIMKSAAGEVTPGQIDEAITTRTRLLSISWVQFLSGHACDLRTIGEICRRRGVIFCVDAIQGLGAAWLDLSSLPIDFLSCGAQKWLLAPQGIGIIYISEELQNRLRQSNVGWLGVKDSWNFLDYNLDLLDTAERYEGGTKNNFGIAGLHGSLSLFRDAGYALVENRVRLLAARLYDSLRRFDLDLMTPPDESRRAGIVSFRHALAEQIFLHLESRRINVSHRVGAIRIAPHFYNTEEEIDIATDAIAESLRT